MMTDIDVAFTNAWWSRTVADEAKLIRWLQKLRETEFSGYKDNRDAAAKWTTHDDQSAAKHIFLKTGDDEMRHSDLLVEILRGRGVWPTLVAPPQSIYWEEMDREVDSLGTCAAVFHLGEQLAADRFSIMYAHPGTPKDVFGFLLSAIPDEQHHARIFAKLTNAIALGRVAARHNAMVLALKGESSYSGIK